MNVGKGDAILTSPFTYIATAEVIKLLGATPIFADIDSKTFNIDTVQLDHKVSKMQDEGLSVKGVIPVNLFGLSADYDEIYKIASKYNIFVLEDAAQSFGAKYKGKISGNLGDISATSFFPAKPLGCYGDGGAIFTNNKDNYDIRLLKPKYGFISERKYILREVIRLKDMDIQFGGEQRLMNIKSAFIPETRVQVYFLQDDDYFKPLPQLLYKAKNGRILSDNDIRFGLFAKVALDTLKRLYWKPDIIVCND